MPETRAYFQQRNGTLTPLEREIRDLLQETQILPMSTPGEIENARQVALELKDYAKEARDAALPYTAMLLLARRGNIEWRLKNSRTGPTSRAAAIEGGNARVTLRPDLAGG